MATLLEKIKLLKGLFTKEIAYVGPFYITMDITRRCNTICLGCFFHCSQKRIPSPGNHQVEDLPFELVQKICAELPGLSTREIILSGEGEPFLHPKLIDFISTFKGAGFKVQAFTNGTLTDQPMAQRIVESGLDVLHVTFWAINREEHEKWHPGVNPTFLEKRIEGLELVTRAKKQRDKRLPLLNLQMPLHRYNFKNIKGRVELALASGCDAVTFGFFRDWGGEFADLGLVPEDTESILHDLMEAKRHFEFDGIGHNVEEYLARVRLSNEAWSKVPCYAGWIESYVKVDGTVLPCPRCRLVMGNLMERSFKEIWNGFEYREFRNQNSDLKRMDSLGGACNCSNCCIVKDNLRVHRIFRWLAPFVPKTKNREEGWRQAR